MGKGWKEALKAEWEASYLQELALFLEKERREATVYPPSRQVFYALECTPFEKVRVVIVGQDPYHGAGQAHGLCFSVPPGIAAPPSLQNIFKELTLDLDLPPESLSPGLLESWAAQGVLLLNAVLTVRAHAPASHAGRGWERFTDALLAALVKRGGPLVFMLWGKYAQTKGAFLPDDHNILILKAPHPSPFSAHTGFLGCRHFSRANSFLSVHGQAPIRWAV